MFSNGYAIVCLFPCPALTSQAFPTVGANLRQLRHTLQHVYSAEQSLNITEDLVEQLKADEELCRNINSCAQNQSRIADDVLALARINLDMLHFVLVSADNIDRTRIELNSTHLMK